MQKYFSLVSSFPLPEHTTEKSIQDWNEVFRRRDKRLEAQAVKLLMSNIPEAQKWKNTNTK